MNFAVDGSIKAQRNWFQRAVDRCRWIKIVCLSFELSQNGFVASSQASFFPVQHIRILAEAEFTQVVSVVLQHIFRGILCGQLWLIVCVVVIYRFVATGNRQFGGPDNVGDDQHQRKECVGAAPKNPTIVWSNQGNGREMHSHRIDAIPEYIQRGEAFVQSLHVHILAVRCLSDHTIGTTRQRQRFLSIHTLSTICRGPEPHRFLDGVCVSDDFVLLYVCTRCDWRYVRGYTVAHRRRTH